MEKDNFIPHSGNCNCNFCEELVRIMEAGVITHETETGNLKRYGMHLGDLPPLVLTPEAIRFNEVHYKCNKQMDRQDAEIQRQAIEIERLNSQVVSYERKMVALRRLLATDESAFAPN